MALEISPPILDQIAKIPGCRRQAHTPAPSGHLTQEEPGPLLAKIVREFAQAKPLPA